MKWIPTMTTSFVAGSISFYDRINSIPTKLKDLIIKLIYFYE